MIEAGTKNAVKRSDGYRPEQPVQLAPIYNWPPRLPILLRWITTFIWPWQLLLFTIAVGCWMFLTPSPYELKDWSTHSLTVLLIRNGLLLILFAGVWHFWLYVRKSQGTEYKYSSNWLSVGDRAFLFGSQLWDNVFWNLSSAVPIWSAYEALSLWLHSNRYIPAVEWGTDPIYCTLLALVIPLWIQIHFYAIHRLIHWQPLYRSIHYIHHKNVNVGPWSGLAMHPLEHLLLFSSVVILWIVPSHPVHCIFVLVYLALGPTISHSGFARVKLGKSSVDAADYMHYLHHKHLRVNYGSELVPFDKWFGTFHDGSAEAEEAMKRRARERASQRFSKKP